MKKIIGQITLVMLLAMTITSCGKHRDGTSVWAGGLWLVPTILGIGSIIFFVLAWISGHSGSIEPGKSFGEKPTESKVNVPFYKHGFFIFSVCLAIACIASIILVNWEK